MTVDKQLVSSIGRGVLVFAAVAPEDTQKEVEAMAAKVLKLKIWPNEDGGTVLRSIRGAALELLLIILCVVEAECSRHSG